MLTAISAGCVFSVSVRSSAGPSRTMRDRFMPSASSTSSSVSRAIGNAASSASPIPTAWEPCPGNAKAIVITIPTGTDKEKPTRIGPGNRHGPPSPVNPRGRPAESAGACLHGIGKCV